MMFFELKHRIESLPFTTKLWMYPLAYSLLGLAKGVVWAVDKFNQITFRRMSQYA
jgi:hypothetical protein